MHQSLPTLEKIRTDRSAQLMDIVEKSDSIVYVNFQHEVYDKNDVSSDVGLKPLAFTSGPDPD